MTINDNFLPYEHCKMLKDLGFDEPCIAYFFDRGGLVSAGEDEEWFLTKQNSTLKQTNIAAALWQQVEEWLWEKHTISFLLEESEDRAFGDDTFICRPIKFDKEISYTAQASNCPIIAKKEGIKAVIKYFLHNK